MIVDPLPSSIDALKENCEALHNLVVDQIIELQRLERRVKSLEDDVFEIKYGTKYGD